MVSAKPKPKSLFLVSTWLKFLIEPKLRPKFLIYPKSGQNSLYSWKYLMIRPTISEIKQDFCWKLQFQLFTLLPLYLCIFAQATLQPQRYIFLKFPGFVSCRVPDFLPIFLPSFIPKISEFSAETEILYISFLAFNFPLDWAF